MIFLHFYRKFNKLATNFGLVVIGSVVSSMLCLLLSVLVFMVRLSK
jgi:hypothetical protein